MADISKIVLGGTTYNIKDTVARAAAVGGMHFLGVSLSEIADDTTNVAIIKTSTNTANRYYTGTAPTGTTYTYSSTTYTLTNVKLIAGDVVIHRSLEFVFSDSDSKWHELGSTGTLGKLAYKDGVSVTYKKATDASFTGTKATITHKVNQGKVSATGTTSDVKVDSHSYTPTGTVTNGTPTTKKVSSGVNTSKLVTTTVHDTPTLDAPTDSVSVDTGTVQTSNISLRGVSGTTTAVDASYKDETLTLSAVIAATANATASSVVTGLKGTTTFVKGLTGTTTFVKSATLSAGTVKTVATGSVASDGRGAAVAISSNNDIDAITELGTPTFTGDTATIDHTVTQGKVSVTGTTSEITVNDHTYTPAGSVTITNTDTTVTGS